MIKADAEREAPCAGLRIGDVAPDFSARSTTGDIRLSDHRGRWLILFSHPADFTPVCTTEFVALAKSASEFEKRDCALMALSVDSLFSHFAWLRLIRDRYDIEVRFPIPPMSVVRPRKCCERSTRFKPSTMDRSWPLQTGYPEKPSWLSPTHRSTLYFPPRA